MNNTENWRKKNSKFKSVLIITIKSYFIYFVCFILGNEQLLLLHYKY